VARSERGFTLLEVMVALAILGLAVVASIQGFAQGLRLLKLSGDHQRAMLLADLKAREIVTLEETEDQGTEDQFQWQRSTRLLEAPDLTPEGGTPPRWRVWQIAVRVRWDGQRQVEVTTLRTAAVTSDQEATARGQAPAPGTPASGTLSRPSSAPGATTPGSPPLRRGTSSSRGATSSAPQPPTDSGGR
jgi:prepilin-type N-terminal cleavage/methylation domain-containing protein